MKFQAFNTMMNRRYRVMEISEIRPDPLFIALCFQSSTERKLDN